MLPLSLAAPTSAPKQNQRPNSEGGCTGTKRGCTAIKGGRMSNKKGCIDSGTLIK